MGPLTAGRATLSILALAFALAAIPTPMAAQSPSPATGASDAWWQELIPEGDYAGVGDSLQDVVDAADLIVVGRPIGLEPFAPPEGTGSPHPAGQRRFDLLTLAVDEAIAGEVQSLVPGTIRVRVAAPWQTSEAEHLRTLPVGERSVFLLYDLAHQWATSGVDPPTVASYQGVYGIIDPWQSVIRDIDGVARGIHYVPLDDFFPGMYEGDPFEELLVGIREAADHP